MLAALNDPAKHVVVGPAPSIRVTLGECFGLPIGTNVEGKMVTALRRLGFDKVFDVDTAADFTILEEGTEFLSRLNGGGTLPLITSCSPGWVRYLEQHAPDMLRNISSCKSPQQMFGSLVKTYYAEQAGIDPQDIFVVSIIDVYKRQDWAWAFIFLKLSTDSALSDTTAYHWSRPSVLLPKDCTSK